MQTQGVVHRDLKLENILIDKCLNVKIADFGLALSGDTESLTSFCGSQGYMAPELEEKKEHRGTETDIFSLGVILFILVTGLAPFKKATLDDKNFRHLASGK